jgi:hypothetical protein
VPLHSSGLQPVAQSRVRPSVATVRFNVIDCFGRRLDYKTEKFIRSEDSVDFSKRFTGLGGREIPFGDYRYVLERVLPPANRLSGRVSISHNKEWITICMDSVTALIDGQEAAVDFQPSGRVSLKGRVSPVPQSLDPTWIKLQSLYTRNATEAEVTSTGTFEFSEPLHGDYLVLVFSGNRLLHAEPISIIQQMPSQYLEITLSGQEITKRVLR